MHVSACLQTIASQLTYCFLLLYHSLVSNSLQSGEEPYLVDISGNCSPVGLAEKAISISWFVSMSKKGPVIIFSVCCELSQCALLMLLCKYIVSTEGFLGNWRVHVIA